MIPQDPQALASALTSGLIALALVPGKLPLILALAALGRRARTPGKTAKTATERKETL